MWRAGLRVHEGAWRRAFRAKTVSGTGLDWGSCDERASIISDLVVSSLDRSLQLYRELLGPLGYTRAGEIVGERSERVVYLSGSGVVPFSLREAQTPGDHNRYRVGLHHVAFEASSRDLGRRAGSLGSRAGLEIENNPQEYDYRPGYYAGFFYDPDGIKLEIVHAVMEDCSLPQVERDVRDGSTDQISRSSRGTELTHPHPPDGNQRLRV